MTTGDLHAVQHHTERGIDLYCFEDHGEYGFVYGNHDPGICARYSNALALWLLGYHNQAKTRLEESLELTERHTLPQFISHGLMHSCVIYMLLGDVEAVRKIHAWAHPLTLETGNQELSSHCDLAYGWIRVQEHDYTEGIKLISHTLAARPPAASNYYRNFYLSVLADSCFREGRHKENPEFLQQAHQDADATGEHWWKAELHRLDGQTYLLNSGSDEDKACKCFQQALDKSRAQGAKILELRAASDMSRLLRNQGNQHQAYDLLAPVYEWFTEGFETTDLRDAKALLDELS